MGWCVREGEVGLEGACMCGAGAGECPRLQPAAPLGVPVFLIEISADASQVLVSQPTVMRHGGVDGWERTV